MASQRAENQPDESTHRLWFQESVENVRPETAEGTRSTELIEQPRVRVNQEAVVSGTSNGSIDERFALHHFVVGVVLSVWGFLLASGLTSSPDQKVLASHSTLMKLVDVLQYAACFNGLVLVISGIGIREKQNWGHPLAVASALASVVCGLVFLVVWKRLIDASRGGEIIDSIATLTFVRTNLDMLIGLADGFGLLLFLMPQRVLQQSAISSPEHSTQ